jgi:hypothetical protein
VSLFAPAVEEGDFSGTGATPTPDCPAGVTQLAPGESMVCQAPYTVTAADVAAGSLRNTAVATADDAGDLEVSSTGSTATVLLGAIATTGVDLSTTLAIALGLVTLGGAVIGNRYLAGRRG